MLPKGVVEVLIRAKDATGSALSGFMSKWKGVLGVIAKITAGAVAATLALMKLGQQGAKMVGVQTAFARTTDDSAEALERLREASGGTITDLELMQRHNQALALGTARSTEEFARMLKVADALGDSLGIDGAEAMERFADVMASGSQRAARALGIEIEAGMTRNEILERAEEVAGRIKGDMGEGAEAADRFWTSVKNGKDRIAELVAQSPAVATFFNTMAFVIEKVVNAIERMLKLLHLVPQDAGALAAGAGAGGGGGIGAAAPFESDISMFRNMTGFGLSAEARAAYIERQDRLRRARFGPSMLNPNATMDRFNARQGMALPGVTVSVAGEGADKIANASDIVVDSFERMSEAAISESARMSDAIIGSLQQVVANIKMKDGGLFGSTLFGGVLGVGLGLLGAAFSRRRDPVPVALHDVSDRAAQQMREKGGPPIRITTIVEQAGVEISRIERELHSRQQRDAVVRYSPTTGDVLGGR